MAQHKADLIIQASPQQVFTALTQPDLVQRWQYNKQLMTDWTPGSGIRFRAWFNNTLLEQWGTVLEYCPGECIKYTLFTPKPGLQDVPENYHTTTYTLHAEGKGTRVELIQEDEGINTFVPVSLIPILAQLKKTVEEGLA